MRGKNTRVVLSLNTVLYNAVRAEAEAMGFGVSEIIDRVLFSAGYGKSPETSIARKQPATTSSEIPVPLPAELSDRQQMLPARTQVEPDPPEFDQEAYDADVADLCARYNLSTYEAHQILMGRTPDPRKE